MKITLSKIVLLLAVSLFPTLLIAQHHNGSHSNSNELGVNQIESDYSLFHSNDVWTTHRNEEIRLSDFSGYPVIAVMVYGNCTQVCPILVRDARRVFEGVDENLRSKVRVAVVTFDPENDTPERWMQYAEKYGLNLPQWQFVTGSSSQIRELAMMLGVEYIKKSDGHFAHSNLVTVLDGKGRIAKRLIGLNQPVNEAVSIIENEIRHELSATNTVSNQHNHK